MQTRHYNDLIRQATEKKSQLINYLISNKTDSIFYFFNIEFITPGYNSFDTVPLLNNAEKALLHIYLRNFDQLINDIDSGNHYFFVKVLPLAEMLSRIPDLKKELKEFWITHLEDLNQTFEEIQYRQYSQELVQLYVKTIVNNLYGFPNKTYYNQDTLNAKAKQLRGRGSTRQTNFINEYLHYEYESNDFANGFDFAPFGQAYFNHALSDIFERGYSVAFNVDLYLGKWINNTKLVILDTYLKKDITPRDSIWGKAGKISVTNLSYNIGYAIVDTRVWRIVPSAGFIISNIDYDSADSLTKDFVTIFPQLHVGLTVDLKIRATPKRYREEQKSNYLADKQEIYPYLRFYGGYNPLGFHNKFNSFGTIAYFQIGLGVFFRKDPNRIRNYVQLLE